MIVAARDESGYQGPNSSQDRPTNTDFNVAPNEKSLLSTQFEHIQGCHTCYTVTRSTI